MNPVNKWIIQLINIITLLVHQHCSVVTGLLTIGEVQLQAEQRNLLLVGTGALHCTKLPLSYRKCKYKVHVYGGRKEGRHSNPP